MSPSRAIARSLLLVALLFVPVAQGSESPEPAADRSLSPYFFVEGGDSGVDRLPLLGTSVHVDIAGVIAHVTVRQSYKNDGTRPIHARYIFPASTRAAVHGLTMEPRVSVPMAKPTRPPAAADAGPALDPLDP